MSTTAGLHASEVTEGMRVVTRMDRLVKEKVRRRLATSGWMSEQGYKYTMICL